MAPVAGAWTFTWRGLALGISFIEAPFRFRAPGVFRGIELDSGRLNVKATNDREFVLAVAALAAMIHSGMDHEPHASYRGPASTSTPSPSKP